MSLQGINSRGCPKRNNGNTPRKEAARVGADREAVAITSNPTEFARLHFPARPQEGFLAAIIFSQGSPTTNMTQQDAHERPKANERDNEEDDGIILVHHVLHLALSVATQNFRKAHKPKTNPELSSAPTSRPFKSSRYALKKPTPHAPRKGWSRLTRSNWRPCSAAHRLVSGVRRPSNPCSLRDPRAGSPGRQLPPECDPTEFEAG